MLLHGFFATMQLAHGRLDLRQQSLLFAFPLRVALMSNKCHKPTSGANASKNSCTRIP